ncbi:hypothetical protein [Yoonia sp. BS5-3]|uniref:Uncharacterized protein n=1 Tax=Yoonia phaeophyticola TaxID=3137369 RepID=A0ABZ2V622_9RHOB
MLKSVITAVTALSLATATPAAANGLDREDVGKLLIGLAAVAVIGSALENSDDSAATPVQHGNSWNGINRDNDWSRLNSNTQRSRRVLPADCLRRVETRFGVQRMYGQRCLERNYRHVNSLPERCEVRVYSSNGPRTGFDPVCLRERGFVSDRRN